jgi:DNA-binding GntR family transcriptional regulator
VHERLVIDRSSTAERVAEALRALMFQGQLVAGEALREVSLAQSFAVSRTTMREALQILSLEGLVTRTPNRGAVVRELSDDDVDEIFHARRILELAGVRARGDASESSRAALGEALVAYDEAAASGDEVRASEAHLSFHNALVGLLDSRRLLATAQSLTSDLRLALATVGRIHRDAPQQVASHRSLLRLVERDPERACRELEAHLGRAQRQLHASRRDG